MGCGYTFVRGAMMTTLKIFFSNVQVVHEENLPAEGPLIIVGNHMNQFVDPMVMLKAAKRQVSFIIAEKSMHRPVIGDVARAMGAVPVIRPQDKAKAGKGMVTAIDLEARTITVEGGALLEDAAQPGCSVAVKTVGQFVVESVDSDEQITFRELPEDAEVNMDNFTGRMAFKVVPKIPQKEVFNKVFDKLREGGCIGIFPEGGSHDNTDLLPLKAGVAVMALGARAQGIPVRVVACGINYMAAHTFRSLCFVDVAPPLEISDELVAKFNEGGAAKIEAGNDLLEEINGQLQSVLFRAPNYKMLKALRIARRMYQNNVKLTAEEYVTLGQRFSQALDIWSEDSTFQELLMNIYHYDKFAWAQGLTDKDVAELPPLGSCSTLLHAWYELVVALAMIIFVTPFILPGLLLSAPIPLRTRCVVRREMEKALAGSSVKIKAMDVAASQKVLVSATMVPALMLFYTVAGLIILFFTWPYKDQDTGVWHDFVVANAWWFIPVFFLFLFPFYVFYFAIVLSESIYRRARHIPSHWLSITSACKRRHKNPAEMLRIDRKKLVVRVQQYVEDHISEVPGWAENRVISAADIRDRRSKTTLALMESGDLTPSLSVDGLSSAANNISFASSSKSLAAPAK